MPYSNMKEIHFIKDCNEVLRDFPIEVRSDIGQALFTAQIGERSPMAKPLKGFAPAVIEVCDNHDGNTYRAVYTIKIGDVVYVLHIFQKKSKKGIATPKHELDLIKQRLKEAKAHHAELVKREMENEQN